MIAGGAGRRCLPGDPLEPRTTAVPSCCCTLACQPVGYHTTRDCTVRVCVAVLLELIELAKPLFKGRGSLTWAAGPSYSICQAWAHPNEHVFHLNGEHRMSITTPTGTSFAGTLWGLAFLICSFFFRGHRTRVTALVLAVPPRSTPLRNHNTGHLGLPSALCAAVDTTAAPQHRTPASWHVRSHHNTRHLSRGVLCCGGCAQRPTL